jgi:hypothetical protein
MKPTEESRSGEVGSVVDKVALGQVSSKYLVSPANSLSTYCSTYIIVLLFTPHNIDTDSIVN